MTGSVQNTAANLADVLQRAVLLHQQGRVAEAERLYGQILSVSPTQFDALHLLGLVKIQQGHVDEGVRRIQAALAANPGSARAWFNLGIGLIQLDRLDEALTSFDRALAIRPDYLEAVYNRGIALARLGRHERAIADFNTALASKADHLEALYNRACALERLARYEEALADFDRLVVADPRQAETFHGRGNVLGHLERFDEAVASYDRALTLQPDFADAACNRGLALARLERYDAAIASFDAALRTKPGHVDAISHRGNMCAQLGRFGEAVVDYERALALAPGRDDTLRYLAQVLRCNGDAARALDVIRRALAINDTRLSRDVFVGCVQDLRSIPGDRDFHDLILRALSEPWCRPSELVPTAVALVKLDGALAQGCKQAMHSPAGSMTAEELLGPAGFAAIAEHKLLRCLLESAPICDIELERFLTAARRAMLASAKRPTAAGATDNGHLGLCCALARQCFITEYAFSVATDERDEACRLRDELAAVLASDGSGPITPLVVAVAAYFPLHGLPGARSLLERTWPDPVNRLITQQVREPLQEEEYRATMPRLTVIEGAVTREVRQQYEENPYPRWVTAAPAGEPVSIDEVMRLRLPFSAFRARGKGPVDILIAGCGTGQQSIDFARNLADARVMAVDISLASLAHAQRKTNELGLKNIEYGQADIAKLDTLGRTFDVIETMGVLHHLPDPSTGWRILLSLLRPNGVMRVGLYSELARRDIAAARDWINKRGFRATADDIRRARQELTGIPEFARVVQIQDFFSTSTCRDLLFHVKEHRFTISEIKKLMIGSTAQFLGFELRPHILQGYMAKFPADKHLIDLDCWQIFETDHPDTFLSMYSFWIQKIA
jgi:tetratricopeptide (TPR) repeat protein/2-polyprenyl-3-methyl-5-hydroxy-6-metoxy-1,4-benzoquinol methylase